MKSAWYYLGLLCGILAGILLVLVIRRLTTKTWRQKNKCYDERQKIAQGIAYKAAYFVLLFYIIVVVGLAEGGITELFMSFAGLWLGVCLSITVFVVICIWKDAYVSIYENPKTLFVTFMVVGVVNLVMCVRIFWGRQPLVVDGKLDSISLNLISCLMLAVITITLYIKIRYNKRCDEDEEEAEE